MSPDSKQIPRVRFALEQPPADKSAAEAPLHAPNSFTSLDDPPPPWEPVFEAVSLLSSLLLCRRPLDPPPPCFSTPSPLRIRSHDFPTFRIPAVSDKITDGFRALYPHNILEGHGISRTDWIRFLEDLSMAARLSNEGLSPIRSHAPVAPSFIYRIFPSRTLGAVYDGHFARSPVGDVRALIQIWNECAFERRKVRVRLEIRPSGRSGGKRNYALAVESL